MFKTSQVCLLSCWYHDLPGYMSFKCFWLNMMNEVRVKVLVNSFFQSFFALLFPSYKLIFLTINLWFERIFSERIPYFLYFNISCSSFHTNKFTRRAWFFSINIQLIKSGLLSIFQNNLVIRRQVTRKVAIAVYFKVNIW